MSQAILQLQKRRGEIAAAVQELAAKEAGGATLSADELKQFDTLQAEFNSVQAAISRAEQSEKMAAAAAQQVNPPKATGPPSTVPAQPRTPDVPGAKVARIALAMAAARGNSVVATKIAVDRGYGDDVAAALNSTTPGAGGVLIPQNYRAELVEMWRPRSVVRSAGCRTIPLVNGTVTMPRMKGGAVVGYIGANTDIPTTEQTFDDLKLSAKKMAAIVPISNDLLKVAHVSPDIERIVANDLSQASAARQDKAFLRDNGTGDTPKGLRHWVLPGNLITASDGTDPVKVDQDLTKAILMLENMDSPMAKPAWVMAPRTFRFLCTLAYPDKKKVYPDLETTRVLKGYPVKTTTQIPINLGAGGTDSEITFADFDDCYIGEGQDIVIDFSSEATYRDANNNIVSAFQRDQSLVRSIETHDFGPRHVESIVILIVSWGK